MDDETQEAINRLERRIERLTQIMLGNQAALDSFVGHLLAEFPVDMVARWVENDANLNLYKISPNPDDPAADSYIKTFDRICERITRYRE